MSGAPELWWIASKSTEEWGGLRFASFTRASNPPHVEVFVIWGELPGRTGPRIWEDVAPREGWVKIERVQIPANWWEKL